MVNAERIPFRRHGGEALCQMVKYAAHGKERSLPTRQLWNHMHLKMSTVGVEGKMTVITVTSDLSLGIQKLEIVSILPEKRSEERRVGKECLRLCRSRWSPYH